MFFQKLVFLFRPDEFYVSQNKRDQEPDCHNQKSEFCVFAHQSANDAVNCRENSAEKNPIGDHFYFGKKRET